MRLAAALLALMALGACEAAQQAADDVARGRAKTAVNAVVTEKFPGVNAAPVTDCIIDAASAKELLQIAASASTGAHADVTELTLGIARRPAALQCMTKSSITLALN